MGIGLYTITTRAVGLVLTAAIYNSDHQNHVNNQNPEETCGYSDDVATMQANSDPGEVGTESLAASLATELEHLRFVLLEMKKGLAVTDPTYWYETISDIDASKLNIASAAQGDVLYRDTSAWARLGAGTSGYFLKSGGSGANPSWSTLPLTGYLYGGIPSNNATDTSKDIDFTACSCRDSADGLNFSAGAMTKQLDATWVAGTNAGGLDTGTIGSSRVIVYMYAIADSTGTNAADFIFSKTGPASGPTLPTGYDVFRCLGAASWAGTSWEGFTVLGKGVDRKFFYQGDIAAFSSTLASTNTYQDLDLSTFVAPGSVAYLTVYGSAADSWACKTKGFSATNQAALRAMSANSAYLTGPLLILTDSSGTIQHKVSANDTVHVNVVGFEMSL